MIGRRGVLASIGASLLAPVLLAPKSGWALSDSTRAQLQYALRIYLDERVVDGRYPFQDPATNVRSDLRLKRIHPVIFKHETEYLLCADFVDPDGQDVVIDYVLTSQRNGFAVSREIVGKRSLLMAVFERLG